MTLHAQTFCHVYCNRVETTYASGVARCDNWKAFVSVLYSKCETGAAAGILYIAIRRDSTRHLTRDIRLALKPLFGLKSLMRKFIFVRLEAAFFLASLWRTFYPGSCSLWYIFFIYFHVLFHFCIDHQLASVSVYLCPGLVHWWHDKRRQSQEVWRIFQIADQRNR